MRHLYIPEAFFLSTCFSQKDFVVSIPLEIILPVGSFGSHGIRWPFHFSPFCVESLIPLEGKKKLDSIQRVAPSTDFSDPKSAKDSNKLYYPQNPA
jgi:hypothetical protein